MARRTRRACAGAFRFPGNILGWPRRTVFTQARPAVDERGMAQLLRSDARSCLAADSAVSLERVRALW